MVPCGCSIHSPTLNLPITRCSYSANISQIYPVNLGLLQQFFSQDDLKEISAETTALSPWNLSLPDFHIFHNDIQNRLAIDHKQELKLLVMAEQAKDNQIIFDSLASPISWGMVQH
jgi:hypothetical protein